MIRAGEEYATQKEADVSGEPFELTSGETKADRVRRAREEDAHNQISLFKGESGQFEPGKIGEAFTKEYEREIQPALEKAGLNLRSALSELQHLIAPRAGVQTDVLDAAMRLTGQREKHRWIL